MHQLVTLDWLVIAAYFVAVFGLAFWVTQREKTTRKTSAGYFLAGRNVGWFVIGASLFASNIGSEHLVGLAGSGANSGVAVGQFEVLASLILLLLGWVFVPFYLKSGVFTMPEFLERRYSPAARWYLAGISIIGYVLTKVSVTLAAGGIVFESLTHIDFWTGAIILVVATGIYTIFGGLRAVLYTDMLQAVVLVGGSAVVMFIGLSELGGWQGMREAAGPGFLTMWKPISDPEFPWTGILFGAPILGVWYWCTDQYIVQRTLSARNIVNARAGTLLAGYLKLLPVFIFVIPGVVAYGLAQSGRIDLAKPDAALPTLIGVLLPSGLRGLVVAGFLAALMSSLSSVFNSCSTLVTWDIYRKLRPEAPERRLVLVGQVTTGVLVVLGLLWVPFMKYIAGQLYVYLQSVQGYIAPPIAAVFLFGLCWKRLNAKGAMTALLTGFVLGALRLILELNKDRLGEGLNIGTAETGFREFLDLNQGALVAALLYKYAAINFLHIAILLFLVCSALLIAVSYATPPASEDQLAGLTFQTAGAAVVEDEARLRSEPNLRGVLIVASILLAVGVGLTWWYFS